nr:hypothetical protein CFP56_56726 [Quercus suber]
MAEELERLWTKLSFTEEEDEGIELDSSCTKAAREIGKNCVIMKILAHKSISIDALRKNMRMLWKPNKGVQISEVGEDLFLVEFGDDRDKKKVLDMCPWSFEKQSVLFQEFDEKLTPKEIDIRPWQDLNKSGRGRGATTAIDRWDTGLEPEKRKATLGPNVPSEGVGGAHVSSQPGMEVNPLTRQNEKAGEAEKGSEDLHQNGKVNGLVEKQVKKSMGSEREASVQSKDQAEVTEVMPWEKSPDFEETLKKIDEELGFKPAAKDAGHILTNKSESPTSNLVRDLKASTDITHAVSPKEKAHLREPITHVVKRKEKTHLIEPIILSVSTDSTQVESKCKVLVSKPKE